MPDSNRQNLVVFSANPVLAGYTREREAQYCLELMDRVQSSAADW